MPPTRSIAIRALLLILAVPALGVAIAQSPRTERSAGCVEDYRPGVDYFQDKAEPAYAENFSVTYHDSYKVVTVAEPYVGGTPQTYVLLQCGAPTPELTGEAATAPVIQIPVQAIFSASTTHNPMFDTLDATDHVTGVATLAYTANQAILDAGAAGHLIEFATTGSTNIEVVIDAEPDIFMTGGGDDPAYDVLRAAGIPVVANAEWLEPSILGRAEWIKYIALFLNEEAAADDVFSALEASYFDAAATVSELAEAERPLVLAGSSFQGIFYASGGRSYVAQAIAAAGGRYVFADNDKTSSIAHPDLELVLDAAAEADFWINSSISYRTLADIIADDPRLAALPAAQSGEVWNYDLIRTDFGGVGFFELGVLRPDLVLRDLIEIFHPGLLDDHRFVFYRPIELE